MDHSNNKIFASLKDYSVSQETFNLYHDEKLDMLITEPQPQGKALSRYYESEDYISHTDAKRSVFEKTYHFIKSIALRNKLNLINSWSPQKGTLLDIGAGTGDFLWVAKQDGWKTTGIEPNGKARTSAEIKGISFAESMASLPDHSRRRLPPPRGRSL